ncbi:MAG: peptide ABC transporter substrate-binding protein [Gemmatimonadaceae bacterium]|nr:peptide ABC transporter substrate-binding protein [Gemmatimonadaceae bacterium]
MIPPRASMRLLALLAVLGCASPDASRTATLVVATSAEPSSLLPMFVTETQGRAVSEQLFDRLSEIGPGLNTVGDAGFAPRLAERWEWSADSLRIAFHLDPRARWHDGQPVRAIDVQRALQLVKDSRTTAPQASDFGAIDSISVTDSLTATAWFSRRSPQQFYLAGYLLFPVPAHAIAGIAPDSLRTSAFARAPIGSGPFTLVSWLPQDRIELRAVADHYRGAPTLGRVVWQYASEASVSVRRLFAGEADFMETLSPPDVAELAKYPEVRAVGYPSFDYTLLAFNARDPVRHTQPHPLFGDRALRRALTMAVDRQQLARALFDSLGAPGLGPFVRAQAFADTTIPAIPFDVVAARATLDSLGWRLGANDSIRTRGGKRLAWSTLVPASSKNRQKAALILQAAFKAVGAEMTIEGLDFAGFLARQDARRFDAAIVGWRPNAGAVSLPQTWGRAGLRPGGNNLASYASDTFDAAVDSGVNALSPVEQRRLLRRAFETIIADAPAIWLYEPRNVAGAHRRVAVPALRPDAWWADLSRWTVAARLPRDTVTR